MIHPSVQISILVLFCFFLTCNAGTNDQNTTFCLIRCTDTAAAAFYNTRGCAVFQIPFCVLVVIVVVYATTEMQCVLTFLVVCS
jgi:hypothetical protein